VNITNRHQLAVNIGVQIAALKLKQPRLNQSGIFCSAPWQYTTGIQLWYSKQSVCISHHQECMCLAT